MKKILFLAFVIGMMTFANAGAHSGLVPNEQTVSITTTQDNSALDLIANPEFTNYQAIGYAATFQNASISPPLMIPELPAEKSVYNYNTGFKYRTVYSFRKTRRISQPNKNYIKSFGQRSRV